MTKNMGFIIMFSGFMLVGLGMAVNAARDGDSGFILWSSAGLCIMSLMALSFIFYTIVRGAN